MSRISASGLARVFLLALIIKYCSSDIVHMSKKHGNFTSEKQNILQVTHASFILEKCSIDLILELHFFDE